MNFTDLLREGDELLEINGVPVIGKSADEIVALMVHMHVCVMSCSTCTWSSITASIEMEENIYTNWNGERLTMSENSYSGLECNVHMFCAQSGDVQSSTVLALTIIPVHDDNIDLEYEPVSSTLILYYFYIDSFLCAL